MIKRSWNQSISEINKNLLSVSDSSEKAALSITVGFYLGLFPVFGMTTALCLAAIFLFRLNAVLMLTVNWLATPLQLIFTVPFLKAGRLIFFSDNHISPEISFKNFFSAKSWDTIYYLFESVVGGIAMWGITGLISGYFLYKAFFRLSGVITKKLPLKK